MHRSQVKPGSSPDDMERQIDQWATHVHEKAQRYQQLKTELARISSTQSAANGAITVTVGPSGLANDAFPRVI
jgi:DNA-binding protein YbaB